MWIQVQVTICVVACYVAIYKLVMLIPLSWVINQKHLIKLVKLCYGIIYWFVPLPLPFTHSFSLNGWYRLNCPQKFCHALREQREAEAELRIIRAKIQDAIAKNVPAVYV
jgi:hypothetical protein